MKITIRDVENIRGLRERARHTPILFDEMRDLIEGNDIDAMMARTEMCHLSNGWLVMFNFEYQRPDVLCKHVAIGYKNPQQATVYATTRIMQILGYRYALRVLPGWDDCDISERYPVVVNVIEPVSCTLEEFHAMTTNDELADKVTSGGAQL